MKRSRAALVLHESRYGFLTFIRNGQSRFFTLGLPVLFLVIFASVFGGGYVELANGSIKQSVYYVPGIMALGVISASFVNLVISVTAARERGIYKRRRATPVPAWVVIAGRASTAVVISLLIAALLLGIGWACPSAGNLCGLAGFFVVGPVASALAILLAGSLLTGAFSKSRP